MKSEELLIIGGGPMASEYAKVLGALEQQFAAVTRKPASAERFAKEHSVNVHSGGIENIPENSYARAIVAVEVENLAAATSTAIKKGIRKILVEKPGALSIKETDSLIALAREYNAEVYIGYNRRYYASVAELKRRLESESILSAHFEFTEWSHKIETYEMPEILKRNWLIANSTHVIDLCFHLIGTPTNVSACRAPGLDWHPAGGVFVGAGLGGNGQPFSYHANWMAPGRWGVEIMTRKNKYILRPLEELRVQPLGQLEGTLLSIDDKLDKRFKPGLYRQTEAFLSGENSALMPLSQQRDAFANVYSKILGGSL